MRRIFSILALIGLTFLSGAQTAAAQEKAANPGGGSVYVLTFVDVTPNFAAEAIKLLREFAAESRKEPKVVRFEVLQQDSRGNHFAMVEVWESRQAFDAHSSLDNTKRFR